MEVYAKVLNYVVPFFILLIIIEAFAARWMKVKINRPTDMISGISSGITNIVKEVLGLTVVIISYAWVVDKIAIIELQATYLVYLIGFIGIDFAGYWRHRIRHEINILWSGHVAHHTSEEFNLSAALRLPFIRIFSLVNFFLVPAAILGIPAEVIAVLLPLHFFLQVWYHTRLINKMGWLESWLVTPSHHRVHHAINPEYLDKNYGNVFIFWDKWFGTFQTELAAVKPIYGVTRPVKTWNPILFNFQHLWLLIKDAWRTNNYWDKLRIWLMPTGWRPADVEEKYPILAVKDVFLLEKYDSNPLPILIAWGWVQLIITLGLMFFLFNHITEIGLPGVFIYGFFILTSIFSYTALLDKASYALLAEIFRMAFGFLLLWWWEDWFGLEALVPYNRLLIIIFLGVSVGVSGYFHFTEIRQNEAYHLKPKV
ncbi:sterol desaturase family protein [Lewinella cohaerens]|uniref:sterol desaturase family protein n=1 Tax=Lewinella cohaerens TaxID=70995 RepID=UPI0003602484|nr:sterol desaturase family protein [Lewinella cohaerens]